MKISILLNLPYENHIQAYFMEKLLNLHYEYTKHHFSLLDESVTLLQYCPYENRIQLILLKYYSAYFTKKYSDSIHQNIFHHKFLKILLKIPYENVTKLTLLKYYSTMKNIIQVNL